MSKFKIAKPATASSAQQPQSIEEFGNTAPMVKSQTGGRPLKPIRLNLDLDPVLHKRLKIAAVEAGEPVAALVRKWIIAGLNQ